MAADRSFFGSNVENSVRAQVIVKKIFEVREQAEDPTVRRKVTASHSKYEITVFYNRRRNRFRQDCGLIQHKY
jgi:hypothetical protein